MMLSIKSLRSPLRYPGSKRRLIPYICQVLKKNGVKPCLYIEPFVGGGSIALQLIHEGLVDRILLMDSDPWVASFWKVVFFDTEWLIEQIQVTEVSIMYWNKIRQSNPQTVRDQAWVCFFLNRTNFSGILEGKAGPIGGKRQKSKYKIDCRFPRQTLIDRICRIAEYKEKIHDIWCLSWEDSITRIRKEQKEGRLPVENILFYLDPPFFEKADTLYRHYFQPVDHIRLRDYLLTLKDKWILSYDSANQVFALYGDALNKRTNGTHHEHVELLYSISALSVRKKAREVILTNLDKLPVQST